MQFFRNLRRRRRLQQLRHIRAVRRHHRDCYFHSDILGGCRHGPRSLLGPDIGLTRDEALRMKENEACGPQDYCRVYIRAINFGMFLRARA